MKKIFLQVLSVLIANSCLADLQITNPTDHQLVKISPELIESVQFNFDYSEHPGTPGQHCSFDGTKATKIFNQIGFSHPEKLPGIPACVITGKVELRLKKGAEIRTFEILCGDLLEERSTGDAFRLSKELNFKICT